ncbi:hypothetical protein GPECTOR_4g923 [Gonium pectorale]|uniref:Uncharacterized protein n=1 Tax=Gonium pectorale TaxID=33097 RepID=A0A150GYE2_GONPE|nr:hypothetical protein GPECTOR_4g923 [Gonium pectorale]|eukprot:KXZ54851.1 hypothetical protein GPECTOR_4g923 [Gonium pectorale]
MPCIQGLRVAAGLLQGGFDVALEASPNVDAFGLELLTVDGCPLDTGHALELRRRNQGALAECDRRLAQSLERLSDLFARRAGEAGTGLALSACGTLAPREQGAAPDPAVGAFNAALLNMRVALGDRYILALHLHKAACLNASSLHDAIHAFHGANGRLAVALRNAGLAMAGAVALDSSYTVCLAGGAPAGPTCATVADPAPPDATARAPAAALAAVRTARPAALGLVSRAVDQLNAALYRVGFAAAAASGPAGFAAMLTHVLGELRELVVQAGGEGAVDAYRPSVQFSRGADLSVSFSLDPHLELVASLATAAASSGGGAGGEGGGGGGGVPAQPPPRFPGCLSPPVRRGWLLLHALLAEHNAAVRQLGQLARVQEAFEEGIRNRLACISQEAAAAGLSMRSAAAASRALARNHAELTACSRGALTAIEATARLVADELEEAVQLASIQCGPYPTYGDSRDRPGGV